MSVTVSPPIPGVTVRHNLSGEVEFHLDDRELYGRTTNQNRQDMKAEIARRIQAEGWQGERARAAAAEARTESRIAYAYVMGIFDTVRDSMSTLEVDAFIVAAFDYSDEVEYASFKFHMAETNAKYGYALAWRWYLRRTIAPAMILAAVAPAARIL